MLKLIVDNTKKRDIITCRNSCELFDPITESCGIKENVNVDSQYETARCQNFLNKSIVSQSKNTIRWNLIGEEEDFIIDDDELFHELIGKKKDMSQSLYPLKPDFSSKREDAYWYVSPDGNFGCWVINDYKKPFKIPSSIDKAEKGWSYRVYKSPIPLHDHKTPISLASKVAWYIDEEGYGQYVLLICGKISAISSPKPSNWRNSH
ncbi:hypothetical protein NSQ82_20565 [Caldifermentibacillus hisashii]|uniref:hypothetical protein n=1 Tax=Caldifermentibacillus hisashii TaxID=996558 RepID=UPI0022B9B06C|nr:hypothetical protein [Caldifermentibacillus hisashii]